jgi:hypothetical protein
MPLHCIPLHHHQTQIINNSNGYTTTGHLAPAFVSAMQETYLSPATLFVVIFGIAISPVMLILVLDFMTSFQVSF